VGKSGKVLLARCHCQQRAGSREQRIVRFWSKLGMGVARADWNVELYDMGKFRFEDLKIWQDGMTLTMVLLDFASVAEERKYYKFAEQLRSATMSITNNIAEGSGSDSDKDFARFLIMSRRSVFECVNILYIFEAKHIIAKEEKENLYSKLLILSRQITNFRKSLIGS